MFGLFVTVIELNVSRVLAGICCVPQQKKRPRQRCQQTPVPVPDGGVQVNAVFRKPDFTCTS